MYASIHISYLLNGKCSRFFIFANDDITRINGHVYYVPLRNTYVHTMIDKYDSFSIYLEQIQVLFCMIGIFVDTSLPIDRQLPYKLYIICVHYVTEEDIDLKSSIYFNLCLYNNMNRICFRNKYIL